MLLKKKIEIMDWDKLKIFHNVALDLNISELENWITKNELKKIFKYFSCSGVYKKIKTLKIKNSLLSGKKMETIKELLTMPIDLHNFKFFPFVFFPNKITKKIILK